MKEDFASFLTSLDVASVWAALGFQGSPSRSCRCPVHKDDKASFSVYRAARDGRWLWKCHAGCGHGDLADLWMIATGCSKREAFQELRRNFGLGLPLGRVQKATLRADDAVAEVREMPVLQLDLGSDAEVLALSKLRRLPESALRLAINRGILRFGHYRGERSWVITDSTGKAISCRPLSGNSWKEGPKAMMVKNTQANHLIGLPHVEAAKVVYICEGGPDLLAGHALAEALTAVGLIDLSTTAVTALLAASVRPQQGVCEAMRGKRIVIWAHADLAGMMAAETWAGQFRPYAASLSIYDLGSFGREAKDLNDIIAQEGGVDLLVARMKGATNA